MDGNSSEQVRIVFSNDLNDEACNFIYVDDTNLNLLLGFCFRRRHHCQEKWKSIRRPEPGGSDKKMSWIIGDRSKGQTGKRW